jgi:anti-anti-sigma regulatory factor
VKVTIQQREPGQLVIQIEGKVTGEQVAELDRAWQETARALGDAKLSLDIRGVTYLDGGARNLLAGIFAETQAQFIADTPLTKYFAEQAQQGFRPGYGKNLNHHSELK